MAGKQTALEQEGIDLRKEALLKNFYQAGNVETEYSEQHEDTKTHTDESHPWGKGTPEFGSEAYLVPDHSKSRTQYKPLMNTEDAGGSYDRFGRNGIGGRNFLTGINIYGPTNEYGEEKIDTSINVDEYGQYVFTTRENERL